MLENQDEIRAVVFTVTEILKADKLDELTDILNNAQFRSEQTDYDGWNGGTYAYTLYLMIDIGTFVKIRDRIQTIESALLEKFNVATRHIENEGFSHIAIVPKAKSKIDWTRLGGFTNKSKLIEDVNYLKKIR